ncbi:hypothetical protein STSO111631_11780 [Stackebrandtia soli]
MFIRLGMEIGEWIPTLLWFRNRYRAASPGAAGNGDRTPFKYVRTRVCVVFAPHVRHVVTSMDRRSNG